MESKQYELAVSWHVLFIFSILAFRLCGYVATRVVPIIFIWTSHLIPHNYVGWCDIMWDSRVSSHLQPDLSPMQLPPQILAWCSHYIAELGSLTFEFLVMLKHCRVVNALTANFVKKNRMFSKYPLFLEKEDNNAPLHHWVKEVGRV